MTLPFLVTRCATLDNRFLDWMEAARELTDYAIEARYPDDWRDIPLEEAAHTVQQAKKFQDFVSQLIRDMAT